MNWWFNDREELRGPKITNGEIKIRKWNSPTTSPKTKLLSRRRKKLPKKNTYWNSPEPPFLTSRMIAVHTK